MEKIFLQIIGENQRIIHKISRMYRDSEEDRQDLFQEIVFQLWKSFPEFRHESKPGTWIYRIALNTAISTYRKRKVLIDLASEPPETSNNFEFEVSENEERMYLALQALNDAEKAIISLYLDDYSYSEIAEIMGITENNVGVRINRIKEKLKVIVKK
jgi:RNA polymerase sigma factor (sigma-70 family)